MPEQFWGLTVREFHIKHAAFSREQDRQRSLVFELAAMIGQFGKKSDRDAVKRSANVLRRYPVKQWLRSG